MEQEKVTLTNAEIINLYNSLTPLYRNSEIKFPIRFTYALYKNILSLEEIAVSIQNFYNQNFSDLDLQDINGRSYNEEKKKEYNDFCAIENEITIEKCTIDDLRDIELSLQDYQAIDFMIK